MVNIIHDQGCSSALFGRGAYCTLGGGVAVIGYSVIVFELAALHRWIVILFHDGIAYGSQRPKCVAACRAMAPQLYM